MILNMVYIRFFCLVGVLLTVPSCIDDDYCYVKHRFQIDYQIIPNQSVFNIGDTIQISSIIDRYTEDLNSGEIVDLGVSFTFPLHFVVERPVDSLPYNSSFYDFTFIEEIGVYSVFDNGDIQTLDLEYELQNEKRVVDFYLVPNQIGTFMFAFGYGTNNYQENFLIIDNSCNEVGELKFVTNEGISNYYLMEEIGDLEFPADSLTFVNEGGFAFKVVK